MMNIRQYCRSQLLRWPKVGTRIVNLVAVSMVICVLLLGSTGSPVGVAFAASPLVADDFYSTDEDTALTVPAAGILANDTDADGDPITPKLVTGPTNGALTINLNGSFTYIPNPNYHGNDSFTYNASDGTTSSNIATVTLTINPVNDVPVAENNAFTLDEDTLLDVADVSLGLLANDVDVDGDSLSAILVTPPAHGRLTLNPGGTFTYDPDANYHGDDSFTYKAYDGSANSSIALVALTIDPVNDLPVATDDAYRVDRNATLNATLGVLGNDEDADSDIMTASLATSPAHGLLDFYPNGTFTYTPDKGYLGTDSFTYKVNDGTADTLAATVVLTVNTAPVASDNAYALNEDTTLTIATPGVLGNDMDPDGSTLTAVLVTGPDHGTLTLNGDGSLVYVPWTGYHGIDWFTYRAYDGVEYSVTKTVTITVNSINDVPVAYDDVYSIDEDGSLHVQASGVLGNDADADGDSLAAYLISGTGHGSLTLYGNGSFSYQPSSNYHGEDSFTYRAGDGTSNSTTATVHLKVNSVNDHISVGDISHSEFPAVVGVPVEICLSFKDIDQGDTRTARIFWGDGEVDWATVKENSGSGTITGEYAYKKPGTYQITVMVFDGGYGPITRDTSTFEVLAVKPAPVNNSPTSTATPAVSVPAITSPTPTLSPTSGTTPATENPLPSSWWQSWMLIAVFIGLAAVAVAGYLIFFRRSG